ncbi:hypothetical protein [Saccharothrix xinjiangensis]|uniref:Uncharacterized protein n=1 Tax=Saccharothrix xinjiangensis TaxID=204798 RepID=A0ABV9Y7R0_9PSEU
MVVVVVGLREVVVGLVVVVGRVVDVRDVVGMLGVALVTEVAEDGAELDEDEDDDVVDDVGAPEVSEAPETVVTGSEAVGLGRSLPFTTTMCPTSEGAVRGGAGSATVEKPTRAASAEPTSAPRASRPGPPNSVSIHHDYRPHPSGSNRVRQLAPARHFGYQAGTSGAPLSRGWRSA